MPKFSVNIKFEGEGFDSTNEVEAAIHRFLDPALESYMNNFGLIVQKPISVTELSVTAIVPGIKDMDVATATRLLSRSMTSEDRAKGVYRNRGVSAGALYLIEDVIRPLLKESGAGNYFEFFIKSRTGQVLVQDHNGLIIHDFVVMPDKVMDIGQFVMTLKEHIIAHEEDLKVYDIEKPVELKYNIDVPWEAPSELAVVESRIPIVASSWDDAPF